MDKILIADDSMMSRMVLLRCLEMAGFKPGEVMQAKNGEEALDMAARNPPDLIITDINMPLMDGEALLIAVKAHPRLKSMPVLIISSALNPAREARLIGLGAIGAVCKPISPGSIREALAPYFKPMEGG